MPHANQSFVTRVGGAVRFVRRGEHVPAGDPVLTGRSVLFAAGVEQATAAPGEVRAVVNRTDRPGPPPRNASTATWADYAAAVGVDVPDDATRAAIIEAVDAAGNPTR